MLEMSLRLREIEGDQVSFCGLEAGDVSEIEGDQVSLGKFEVGDV